MRTARSNATQAITLECVKCRFGPRTSQIPASFFRQPSSSHASSLLDQRPAKRRPSSPARGLIRGVEHLAVDIELKLGRAALPIRTGRDLRIPAATPARSSSRRSPAMPYTICTSAGVAGHRPHQPFAPGQRLVPVTGVQHRQERQGRVTQPAVAVVPVAHAADPAPAARSSARPRSRRSEVGERLEHQQRRSPRGSAPGDGRRRPTRARTSRSRPAPLRDRPAAGKGSCDGYQVSTNGTRSPWSDHELETVVSSSPWIVDRRAQAERVRSRQSRPGMIDAPHPGHDPAVVEADDQLERIGTRPRIPSTMRTMSGSPRGGMKSMTRTAPSAVSMDRLEDQGHGPVAAIDCGDFGRRGQEPATMLRPPSSAAKQAPESNRGKQHQSIDPVATAPPSANLPAARSPRFFGYRSCGEALRG